MIRNAVKRIGRRWKIAILMRLAHHYRCSCTRPRDYRLPWIVDIVSDGEMSGIDLFWPLKGWIAQMRCPVCQGSGIDAAWVRDAVDRSRAAV